MSSPLNNNNAEHNHGSPHASIQGGFLLSTRPRRRGRPPTARPCQYCDSIQESYQALTNHTRYCLLNPNNNAQQEEYEERNQDVEMSDISNYNNLQQQDDRSNVDDDETAQDDLPDYTDDGMDVDFGAFTDDLLLNDGGNEEMTATQVANDGKFQIA